MEVRELICIGWPLGCPPAGWLGRSPLGCPLTVRLEGDEVEVSGNTCVRGADYAKKEVLSPTRIVTSSVHVDGGTIEMVSVKTEHDIPKGKIFECMDEIRKVTIPAPVKIGDVVIADCAGTIVATKNVEAVIA